MPSTLTQALFIGDFALPAGTLNLGGAVVGDDGHGVYQYLLPGRNAMFLWTRFNGNPIKDATVVAALDLPLLANQVPAWECTDNDMPTKFEVLALIDATQEDHNDPRSEHGASIR